MLGKSGTGLLISFYLPVYVHQLASEIMLRAHVSYPVLQTKYNLPEIKKQLCLTVLQFPTNCDYVKESKHSPLNP